jgi:transcription termination factor Rho
MPTRSFKPKDIKDSESGSRIVTADDYVGVPSDTQNTQSDEGHYSGGYNSGDYSRSNSNYRRNDRDRAMEPRDVPTEQVSGYLDIMPEGHGFLRPKYTPSDRDVYISASQIRRFNLRGGDFVEGGARQPKENERYFGLLQVDKVNDKPAEKMVAETGTRFKRTKFEDLTPIYPNRHLKLETGKFPASQRVIDLIPPSGHSDQAR